MSARRLSICYLVPGHDLLASVGPTRNVISLAQSLQEWADVTVAFRRVSDQQRPAGIKVLEIDPGVDAASTDDAAMRGIGYFEFFRFMRVLRRFVSNELGAYDVVLEKSWLLSGYASEICRRRGQLGVPIENIVAKPSHAARGSMLKRLRLETAHWIAGRAIRKAPLIIAETEFLKREIAQHWGVQSDHIAVVDLGVDRARFKPLDRDAARAQLGIDTERTILTYVGVLDFTHNLEPAIRALGNGASMRAAQSVATGAARVSGALELHIVGDGMRREEYERLATGCGAPVVFHGRVEHDQVPGHIAASDLCLAPYDASAFSSGELGYSTMKIPEYLGVGRPVVSVPSGRIRSLIAEGKTGFLFMNEPANWTKFIANLPTRARLHEMGAAAAQTKLTSWEDTAKGYLSLCQAQLARLKGNR